MRAGTRTGLIAKKVGMTRVFREDGEHLPVTVLQLERCQIVAHRTPAEHGYAALQLGAGVKKAKRVNRAERGYFAKAAVEPKMKLVEFRIDEGNYIDVGAELSAAHFLQGQKVDVTGVTVGKGFAGAMKRHNFGGMRASHGVSVTHRAHGSTGQRQDPGKVFRGKKMAGHMGARRRTTQNVEVVRTDTDRGLILIKGAIPGPKGGWVLIQDAVKRPIPSDVPTPGAILVRRNASAADTRAADGFSDAVDRIILIDGIGEKTAEALSAEGLTKLTDLVALDDEARSALFEKLGFADQAASQEWIAQAEAMIAGEPPRAKVDQELAAKLRAQAAGDDAKDGN